MSLRPGALLFVLLPRCFSATYGPGPTLRETAAVPGAKAQIAWVAAVYVIASMIMASASVHLLWVTLAMATDGVGPDFGYRSLVLAVGLGALAWGIASDFFPVRCLLIILAALSLPATGWGWLFDDPAGGVLLLSLVEGGLVSLPWVLMAEALPTHHFAKLALAIAWVGQLGGMLWQLYWGLSIQDWGVDLFIWIVLVEAGLLAALGAFRPRVPESFGNQPIQQR